jgi:2-hydroxychromene-2-carboxylate isomerase
VPVALFHTFFLKNLLMPVIEYFYASYSAFAYLGSRRLMEIADAAGVKIIHRPYDLRKGLTAIGLGDFAVRSAEHKAYYFKREIDRWSEFRNAPVLGYRPTHHDKGIALSNGMLIAGLEQGVDIGELAHAMLEGHWLNDANLDDRESLAALAVNVGLDPQPLLDAAMSDEIQAIYDANTQESIERSVFGSPTYFVDGDMFYGQDHLELVERALKKPFQGDWPIG